jgi:hypothetical protein
MYLKMDKTTTQIFSLLPNSQQQELLERAVKGLQEKVRVIVSNLSAEKLILAHDYLTKLTTEQKEQTKDIPKKHRPPPSYVSTPDESDVDYSDMPPLVDDNPHVVKNIYNGWMPCDNTGQSMCFNPRRK